MAKLGKAAVVWILTSIYLCIYIWNLVGSNWFWLIL